MLIPCSFQNRRPCFPGFRGSLVPLPRTRNASVRPLRVVSNGSPCASCGVCTARKTFSSAFVAFASDTSEGKFHRTTACCGQVADAERALQKSSFPKSSPPQQRGKEANREERTPHTVYATLRPSVRCDCKPNGYRKPRHGYDLRYSHCPLHCPMRTPLWDEGGSLMVLVLHSSLRPYMPSVR